MLYISTDGSPKGEVKRDDAPPAVSPDAVPLAVVELAAKLPVDIEEVDIELPVVEPAARLPVPLMVLLMADPVEALPVRAELELVVSWPLELPAALENVTTPVATKWL